MLTCLKDLGVLPESYLTLIFLHVFIVLKLAILIEVEISYLLLEPSVLLQHETPANNCTVKSILRNCGLPLAKHTVRDRASLRRGLPSD